MNELKYCKFCDKEKPIKDFVKSGFAIKNICRECQNKKQTQIYKNSKEVEKLEQENKQLKEKIKKTIRMLEIQIEVIKVQPSDNALNDNMEIKQREMVIRLLKEVSE